MLVTLRISEMCRGSNGGETRPVGRNKVIEIDPDGKQVGDYFKSLGQQLLIEAQEATEQLMGIESKPVYCEVTIRCSRFTVPTEPDSLPTSFYPCIFTYTRTR